MPLCYLITVLKIGDPDVISTRTVLRSRILTIRGATALCDVHTATMSERLQTVLVRRTTAKRRITNIASRFSRVLTDDNACQTVHDLRFDLTIHQRLTRAFAIDGVDVNGKPSQWMARFAKFCFVKGSHRPRPLAHLRRSLIDKTTPITLIRTRSLAVVSFIECQTTGTK